MSYVPVETPGGRVGNSGAITISTPENFSRGPSPRNGSKTNRGKAKPRGIPVDDFPIIVHSHLCWDWVWQRPQQFLSRLSHKHKILFVETVGPDPQLAAPYARFRHADGFPNIWILRIQFPTWQWADGAFVDKERRRLVQQALKSGPLADHFKNPVQWFYDPMAVTAFGGRMNEIATVYDCMDELSKFKGAPPVIVEREQELLALADVVFTGGRKMFEAKRRFNGNCHFYGCGVDVVHFGKARDESTRVPDDLAHLKKPVLGYFGVVDERMDYELVAKLADANPEWSVAIIGPAIKVEPAQFPSRPNLHWLGGRDYQELPASCKGFDVCLMPFAMNEHTEYINPTKSLEYMATGRVIVSSAVPDVISNFGSVVKVARTHDEFIALCREATESPDQKAIERGLKMASENSWESIVNHLDRHIRDVLVRNNHEVLAAA
jgi:glycosyltransferase involved in cell wall biosynthesis